MRNASSEIKTLTFIFYIENQDQREYINFDDIPNGILSGYIQAVDTNAYTIAGARILLSEIHSEINKEMLIGDEKIDSYPQGKKDLQNKLRDDWTVLWNHYEYYKLLDFLSDQDIYNTDDFSSYTYLIKISEVGFSNLSFLRKVSLISSDILTQNIQNSKLTDLGDHNNLDDLIDEVQRFNQEEPTRENTYILFVNKPVEQQYFQRGRAYIPVNAIYKGQFKRKFEHWHLFNVAKGDYPNDYLLDRARAILIPGSGAGAWEDIPWVNELKLFLNRIHQQFTHLKLVGMCFGFQIIAQAFGGMIKQTEGRKQDPNFRVIGNQELRVPQEINRESLFRDVFEEQISKIYLSKSHGDFVEQLPSELFQSLGESDVSPNEIFLSRDKRFLGFQGHPEHSQEFQMRLSATFFTSLYKTHDWNWHLKSEKFQKAFSNPNDHKKLVQVINNFLRND